VRIGRALFEWRRAFDDVGVMGDTGGRLGDEDRDLLLDCAVCGEVSRVREGMVCSLTEERKEDDDAAHNHFGGMAE
jgi:hypothetical protein